MNVSLNNLAKNLANTEQSFGTLVDLLRYRAVAQSNRIAYTFLVNGETEEINITYQELDRLARAIAVRLQSMEMAGSRALLLYPIGLDFIAGFFGCLYAGVVAVPAYPPRPNQSLSRLQAIATNAKAAIALTNTTVLSNFGRGFSEFPNLKVLCWLTTDDINTDLATQWQEPAINSNTLALLQYTSGSTGTPKGVMLNHRNLLHNCTFIHECFQDTPESMGVSWLPLYHDMGLIGGVLQPLYVGAPMTLMSPMDFLQSPVRWLRAISRYKATTSGGPNFAYDLCVRHITPQQRETLDLSSWKIAFNGAEPVRAQTLERFTEAFKSCGFSYNAFYPCYGMAEATLIVSGGLKTEPPILKIVQGEALEQNRVVPAKKAEDGTRTLVSCGQSRLDQQIVIVHPETLTICAPNEVGEIWISGKSVAQGYWNQLGETKTTFQAYLSGTTERPFLRTGDLGFLENGELFITGRIKDLIIIRGRNHYPQDIEFIVEQSHPALRSGYGAAFSVDLDGEERLIVAQEVERNYLVNLNLNEIFTAIVQAVAQQHEIQIYAILLLKPGSIPKTSSGKIKRFACQKAFINNTLDIVYDWTINPRFKAEYRNLEEEIALLKMQLLSS
ncbi:fatty acyl-AMP ligase [Nostoc sp.]|uniref:fatty acyl-AMP ligase n=1 Tax=Nostoc sp. TaxID=1180 RepID=UPI002FFAD63F